MPNIAQTTENISLFLDANPLLFAAIILWTLFWKGMALWKAAQLGQKKWFIAILLINTLGLLEILYIWFVARKYNVVSEEVEGANIER